MSYPPIHQYASAPTVISPSLTTTSITAIMVSPTLPMSPSSPKSSPNAQLHQPRPQRPSSRSPSRSVPIRHPSPWSPTSNPTTPIPSPSKRATSIPRARFNPVPRTPSPLSIQPAITMSLSAIDQTSAALPEEDSSRDLSSMSDTALADPYPDRICTRTPPLARSPSCPPLTPPRPLPLTAPDRTRSPETSPRSIPLASPPSSPTTPLPRSSPLREMSNDRSQDSTTPILLLPNPTSLAPAVSLADILNHRSRYPSSPTSPSQKWTPPTVQGIVADPSGDASPTPSEDLAASEDRESRPSVDASGETDTVQGSEEGNVGPLPTFAFIGAPSPDRRTQSSLLDLIIMSEDMSPAVAQALRTLKLQCHYLSCQNRLLIAELDNAKKTSQALRTVIVHTESNKSSAASSVDGACSCRKEDRSDERHSSEDEEQGREAEFREETSVALADPVLPPAEIPLGPAKKKSPMASINPTKPGRTHPFRRIERVPTRDVISTDTLRQKITEPDLPILAESPDEKDTKVGPALKKKMLSLSKSIRRIGRRMSGKKNPGVADGIPIPNFCAPTACANSHTSSRADTTSH